MPIAYVEVKSSPKPTTRSVGERKLDEALARVAEVLRNPPVPKPGQTQHEANLE